MTRSWSLDRLSAWLAEHGLGISPMQTSRLLDQAGLSFQRTRSWKASPDPDYETRAGPGARAVRRGAVRDRA